MYSAINNTWLVAQYMMGYLAREDVEDVEAEEEGPELPQEKVCCQGVRMDVEIAGFVYPSWP